MGLITGTGPLEPSPPETPIEATELPSTVPGGGRIGSSSDRPLLFHPSGSVSRVGGRGPLLPLTPRRAGALPRVVRREFLASHHSADGSYSVSVLGQDRLVGMRPVSFL